MRSTVDAELWSREGARALRIRIAKTFFSRFAGLMLTRSLPPSHGFLLMHCASVHTAFMRYPIDVVYLDNDGTVVKCVPTLKPWRGSASWTGRDDQGNRHARASHTLELAAGCIERWNIRVGDRLQGASAVAQEDRATHLFEVNGHNGNHHVRGVIRSTRGRLRSHANPRQRGAAMIEFAVVGPIITFLGLALLQYGMLFFARNHINHASFMAARAGSMGNARLSTVQDAYLKALIPLYGGGRNETELAETYSKVVADTAGNLEITLLNPTRESFDDWNDAALQKKYGARAIPNGGLSFKNPDEIKANSGQNIQDANLIKLRIMHGYAPKVPLIGQVYTKYLQWLDPKTDGFHTQLVNAGRIPVVTNVTLQMQSDPIEGGNVSTPGMGNNGTPTDPGNPPVVNTDPPNCATMGCTTGNGPVNPGGGGGNGGGTCPGATTTESVPADLLFEFGKSTLSSGGKSQLDQLIAQAKNQTFDSLTVTGHTDQLGNASFDNDKLSLDRASAVRDYLQSHGFPNKPVNVAGMGSKNPKVALSACPSSGQAQIDCLAPNRRVEFSWARVN